MADSSNFLRDTTKFCLSLYNNPNVPRNAIQEITTNVNSYIEKSYNPFICSKKEKELNHFTEKLVKDKVKSILDEFKSPLHAFSFKHRLFSMFEKHCDYVAPESFTIGTEIVEKHSKLQKIDVLGARIPLQKSLKNLLERPGLLKEILSYIDKLKIEKDIVRNVMQGEWWRKMFGNSKDIILPIFLYYDDFDLRMLLEAILGSKKLVVFTCYCHFFPLILKIN